MHLVKAIVRYELVGNVAVDSGRVIICDPCNASELNYDRDASKQNGQLGSIVGVIHDTATGDGVYPVFAEWRGERLHSLIIRFY